MDNNRRLINNLRKVVGKGAITIYQGIVKSVEGDTCTCTFGAQDIADIRLRASLTEREKRMLVVPAVGSAVVVGSLSGDLSELVVLQVDEIASIEVNGGQLGGLINIEALTDKINELVDAFNQHTHTMQPSTINVSGSAGASTNPQPVTVPAISSQAARLDRADYEDETVTH